MKIVKFIDIKPNIKIQDNKKRRNLLLLRYLNFFDY